MTTIGEAVADTGMQPFKGWQPVVVSFDKAGKPRNSILSACADQPINGQPLYLTSGWFDPKDITTYQGRTRENVKRIPWLPFDFDLADFVGLQRDRIYAWPQPHVEDVLVAQREEVERIFSVLGLPVHRLEYTGHGLAAYVYLPKHGPEDVAEYGRIGAALVDRINVIAGEVIADPSVKDAGSRFMRLVPSPNTKSDPARETRVIDFVSFRDAPVTLEQLRDAAGPALRADDPPTMIVPLSGEILSAQTVDEIVHAVLPSWQQGSRHAIALGLSGMLAKAGVPESQARTIIERMAAGDEELEDRMTAVATSYARVRSGQDVRGFFKLRETIDADALQWIDTALEGIRKATNPFRLVIGEKPSKEELKVGDAVHEFVYQPIPEAALTGWIAEYTALMLPTTEAPAAFHYASGMVMAGATIGRRIAIRAGSGPLYPNLFAMLVGRSGWSRKDTAIKRATSILREPIHAGTTIIRPDTIVIGNVSSSEGLIKVLDEAGANLLLELPEFSEVMANAERKSTSSIPTTLIRLYDMPLTIENNSKTNPIVVEKPVTSILAATQPHTLAEAMRSLHITSGFANRFLYVCGDSPGPLSMAAEVDRQAVTALYLRLRHLVEAYREGSVLKLNAEALERWDCWYRESHWGNHGTPEEDVMRVRHQDHVMKLALIYAVTDQSDTVGIQHLEPAMATLNWSWAHVRQLMGDWGQRLDNEIENRMLAVLAQRGNMKKRELFQKSANRKWTTPEMIRVFESLIKSGRVRIDALGIVGLEIEAESGE